MGALHLGVDIGSVSINTVVVDEQRRILDDIYTYCRGRPFVELARVLEQLLARYGRDAIRTVALTGSGGALAARVLGGRFVNEIVAQAASVAALHPEARSVIEMGGEDSKLLILSPAGLQDFAMNSMCAAGTGSFLDQQAKRMGLSIEREFGELALKSERPPRIAGRCSVFAKSDMIHLQQIATPLHDIVAGLCFAVARNFKSNVARGKEIARPVLFQGGVAANLGMVRAFRELLELHDGELVVPEHYASMGAIGAVFQLLDRGLATAPLSGLDPLRDYLATDRSARASLEPLAPPACRFVKEVDPRYRAAHWTDAPAAARVRVSLGLDVGSLSTNVVLIDEADRVVARRYLATASRPLEAIQRGLREIAEEVGDRVEVIAAGSTGSGRYLTGDFVGADVVQNEITAQATAAIAIDPAVDTIFEIGGQDSKFISVDRGVVVDFEMNKVCAAGTGSFLEEQAEKLGIEIVDEFGELALAAERPARLGDRCTVFMESDLNSLQQKGAPTDSLVGGLAYSIVYNYLQKVVGTKRIGERIFFQGGVANNRAVVSAFSAVTGKPITVPPHFDVTGAIGVAMLARRWRERRPADPGDPGDGAGRGDSACSRATRFKGFGIANARYALDRFACHGCPNECDIRSVRVEGEERPLYYGGRCEKWEVGARASKRSTAPNLFEERLRMLLDGFRSDAPADRASEAASGRTPRARPTVGIPRALMVFYQQFPFWRAFFDELGLEVLLSRSTDNPLVVRSLEMMSAETCLPVEVVHGHVLELLERGADYLFLPFVVNAKAEPDNPTVNYNCPWIQTYPFMVRAALRARGEDRAVERLLTPVLHFRYPQHVLPDDLARFAGERFGSPRPRVLAALRAAEAAQREFEERVRARGREVLANLPAGITPLVLLGRPYNCGDRALNLSLVEKLLGMEALPIPLDFLPLEREHIFADYHRMYWPNGQRLLAGARIVARDERLGAIHFSNFRCGPDSFLAHYLQEELAGKPYLQLEVDEHSADAGLVTRCEAFLDSLRSRGAAARADGRGSAPHHLYRMPERADQSRTLYFPYMCDGAYALAAACRSCGVEAHVLPMQDDEDIKLARRHTSAKECFPMICTLGSFLKKAREPGFDPAASAFFMPDHAGPCRFGQYNKLERIIFDKLGLHDVAIVAPSNEDSYAGLSGGHGNRFRLVALKGVFAVDLLRKLRQERAPYEAAAGDTERVYRQSLDRIVAAVEAGGGALGRVMREIAEEFRGVRVTGAPRKPIIAVVGEIFMRDNPYCSGYLVERLERLGAETLMAPFVEWLTYSTLRYARDSRWKRDAAGYLRARVQAALSGLVMDRLSAATRGAVDEELDVHVGQMLERCGPYIHRDYDGDPALAIGSAALLAGRGIAGVAHLSPFTCLPGSVVASVSGSFRTDHDELPWVNIDFDGQEDSGIETRLQAFMYQATEFALAHQASSGRRSSDRLGRAGSNGP